MELFSPVGPTCVIAVATLRLVVGAVAAGDTVLAGTVLNRVQPEPLDNAVATVGNCIGIAFRLLDGWMSGQDLAVPTRLSQLTRQPAGHWNNQTTRRSGGRR